EIVLVARIACVCVFLSGCFLVGFLLFGWRADVLGRRQIFGRIETGSGARHLRYPSAVNSCVTAFVRRGLCSGAGYREATDGCQRNRGGHCRGTVRITTHMELHAVALA